MISAEELKKSQAEISEEELEGVAGGLGVGCEFSFNGDGNKGDGKTGMFLL